MADPDPFDDPSYRAFVTDAAVTCRCCSRCWDSPCGACLAGGICDEMACHCDDEPEDDDDD